MADRREAVRLVSLDPGQQRRRRIGVGALPGDGLDRVEDAEGGPFGRDGMGPAVDRLNAGAERSAGRIAEIEPVAMGRDPDGVHGFAVGRHPFERVPDCRAGRVPEPVHVLLHEAGRRLGRRGPPAAGRERGPVGAEQDGLDGRGPAIKPEQHR